MLMLIYPFETTKKDIQLIQQILLIMLGSIFAYKQPTHLSLACLIAIPSSVTRFPIDSMTVGEVASLKFPLTNLTYIYE